MQEIKFQAWHTKLKKMFSAAEMGRDELTLNPDGRGFVNVNGISTKLSRYYPEMIPLQYTGFKDKNNKDGYKDDLLRLAEGKIILRIDWNAEKGQWYSYYKDQPIESLCKSVADGCCFIGNIYENFELLEEKI